MNALPEARGLAARLTEPPGATPGDGGHRGELGRSRAGSSELYIFGSGELVHRCAGGGDRRDQAGGGAGASAAPVSGRGTACPSLLRAGGGCTRLELRGGRRLICGAPIRACAVWQSCNHGGAPTLPARPSRATCRGLRACGRKALRGRGENEFREVFRAGARLRAGGADDRAAREPPAVHAGAPAQGAARRRPGAGVEPDRGAPAATPPRRRRRWTGRSASCPASRAAT